MPQLRLLLLLSHFSRVWLCATPETAAHQAPPSLGFSRQEPWSGLPFPSPTKTWHSQINKKYFLNDVKIKHSLLYLFSIAAVTNYQSLSVMSDSLWPHGPYNPWNSPGQNTGVGSLSLLQGIFQTQESNPGLPHCRQILYQLSYKGSPRILEWVAYPFSSRSSRSRNRTGGLLNCRQILYQLSYEGSLA